MNSLKILRKAKIFLLLLLVYDKPCGPRRRFMKLRQFPEMTPIRIQSTVVQNSQENRLKYWATCSSTHLSTLLCSLVSSLAHFIHFLTRGTLNYWMAIYCVFFLFWTIVQFCLLSALSISSLIAFASRALCCLASKAPTSFSNPTFPPPSPPTPSTILQCRPP